MNDDVKFFATLAAGIIAVAAFFISLILGLDSHGSTPVPGHPNCKIEWHDNNKIFGEDEYIDKILCRTEINLRGE